MTPFWGGFPCYSHQYHLHLFLSSNTRNVLSPRFLAIGCWRHLSFRLSPRRTFDPNRAESLMWTSIQISQPCVISPGSQGHLFQTGLLLVSDSWEATACHTDWCTSVLASFLNPTYLLFFFPLCWLPSVYLLLPLWLLPATAADRQQSSVKLTCLRTCSRKWTKIIRCKD